MKHPIDKVYITQGFGGNKAAYAKFGLAGHNGIDYRTRFIDSPLAHREVLAAKKGKVIEVGDQGKSGYGKFVRLSHYKDEQTIYGHMSRQDVKVGQKVAEGQVLGLTGNTGNSTGSHLHFGFRPWNWKTLKNGYSGYVNPLTFIK